MKVVLEFSRDILISREVLLFLDTLDAILKAHQRPSIACKAESASAYIERNEICMHTKNKTKLLASTNFKLILGRVKSLLYPKLYFL
jgi:hypothetical protein